MKRNTLALTTLLTAMFTLSSAARANEQTDRQAIANRYQAIIKAAVKDASYDVDEHLADALLMDGGTMLASKLIKANPSGGSLGQQNNQVPNIELTKQLVDSNTLTALLVGTWRAVVSEQGRTFEILWTINPNGTSSYIFNNSDGTTSTSTAYWSAIGYNPITITETDMYGSLSAGAIQFTSPNSFVVEITYSFTSGASLIGTKRYYTRIN